MVLEERVLLSTGLLRIAAAAAAAAAAAIAEHVYLLLVPREVCPKCLPGCCWCMPCLLRPPYSMDVLKLCGSCDRLMRWGYGCLHCRMWRSCVGLQRRSCNLAQVIGL
mmetsp:Transcript_34116/g.79933  ORF Transcript_34116/g.79933 Transcript_34116/m.79933 type:complete len:108 (-) Transcript_34116:309-632(-)